MNWNMLSAVGTIVAAFVGVAGILISVLEKRKRLNIVFEMIPNYVIVISNNSTRPIAITKLTIASNGHIFYVEFFQGFNEFIVQPSTIKHLYLSEERIHAEYYRLNMPALCNPKDKIEITLIDNLNRKYRIKQDLTIGFFKVMKVENEDNDQL